MPRPTPVGPGWSRRGLLQLGALGLTLPGYLRARDPARPAATRTVLVFLTGGPSHHETFDPKPDAPAEVRGEFGTVPTALPGVRFSATIPRLAAGAARLAVLRAVTHRDGAHETGVAYMNTGYSFRPGHNFPGIGAVVGHERPKPAGAGLPAYFALPDGRGGGHLGPAHNPFTIPGDPNDRAFRVQDIATPDGLTNPRLERRRRLAEQVNEDFRRSRPGDAPEAVDRFTAQAYDLVTSPAAQAAFDLNWESPRTRDRYGRSRFGQRLLLARRLIEAGVPAVAATDFEWDDHQGIFPKLRQRMPAVDAGLSALVEDLDARGLLDTTLVIVMGEFGRTPKVNAMQGRDHWPNAFSVMLAGGGVVGGRVIGSTDRDGAYPKDRPVTPEELYHSIYVLLGIDPTKALPTTGGREIEIVRDGKFIPELV